MAGRRARSASLPRAHSQHFLRPPYAAELVRDAGLRSGDVVVDVGAGNGRLTAHLARVAGRVVAIELDPRLATALRGRWPNVDVIEADAADVRMPPEPFRVVANLPFSRTNDLLHHLLDDPAIPLLRADVIVQWGVARKRGIPWPSTMNSVVWGASYQSSISRRLPPSAFEPPPSVDAGVLVFQRRAHPLIEPSAVPAYRGFVARGFRHGMPAVVPGRAVARIAQPGASARDLDPYQWAQLWNQRT